jgi:predicted RND superfamily exporter protein
VAVQLAVGNRPWVVVSTVCGFFGMAALLFATGHIESRTRALDYVRGTAVEKQARYLNAPGNPGFEFLDLLVEPAGAGDLYDPHFIARAWEYQHALRRMPDAREVISVLSSLHRIAQESYQRPLPNTRAEMDAAFQLLEGRLPVLVQKQLYFPHGVRVSVSYGFDDSVRLGRFCAAALALARHEFPDLKVSTFGTVPLYPQVDRYVREGKVANLFVSQGGLFILCCLVLAWRGWRRPGVRWVSPLRGGLAMSAPLFVATALIGLLMAALDIPLDIATASIGALAINAAQDFSLYLALAYQDALATRPPEAALGYAVAREGKIILADCVLNTCCFLPLVLSRFSPIAQIGWLMAVMLAACAVGTFFVMAPLLPRCVRLREVGV